MYFIIEIRYRTKVIIVLLAKYNILSCDQLNTDASGRCACVSCRGISVCRFIGIQHQTVEIDRGLGIGLLDNNSVYAITASTNVNLNDQIGRRTRLHALPNIELDQSYSVVYVIYCRPTIFRRMRNE